MKESTKIDLCENLEQLIKRAYETTETKRKEKLINEVIQAAGCLFNGEGEIDPFMIIELRKRGIKSGWNKKEDGSGLDVRFCLIYKSMAIGINQRSNDIL